MEYVRNGKIVSRSTIIRRSHFNCPITSKKYAKLWCQKINATNAEKKKCCTTTFQKGKVLRKRCNIRSKKMQKNI